MNLKFLLIIFLGFLLISCEDNFNNDDDNNCLIDKNVSYTINLNLPLYADLESNGLNGIFIKDTSSFIKGVYVRIIGSQVTAFELAEPNDCMKVCDVPNSLTSEGFFEYTCGEETILYDVGGVKIGAKKGDFNMRQYTTRLENNQLTISY